MQIANAIETDVYVRDKATGEAKVALKVLDDLTDLETRNKNEAMTFADFVMKKNY